MSVIPRSTRREEQAATANEQGPLGGERLVEYSIFLTDAFGLQTGQISFQPEDPASPDTIDGFVNDDTYRSSRHLIRRLPAPASAAAESNLRENSLARQLQEKTDEQPATIRLIRRRDPQEQRIIDLTEPTVPWVNVIPPNTKFLLESVRESREEKVQVIDTFGAWIAFFFGAKPEVYNYSGTLLNAKNHDWKNEFQFNYENFLRGSQAVKFGATMVLQYDDVIVEGYMLNCQTVQQAVSDKGIPFSFNLLVTNRTSINARNMLGQRIERGVDATAAEIQLFEDMQASLALTKDGKADDIETFLLMREYFAGNFAPSAGISTHFNELGMTSDRNEAPGASSGLVDDKPASTAFRPSFTNKIGNLLDARALVGE